MEMTEKKFENVGALIDNLTGELEKKGYTITHSSFLKDGEGKPHHGIVDFIAENKNEVQLHLAEGIGYLVEGSVDKLKYAKELYTEFHLKEEKSVVCYLNGKKLEV